MYFLINDSPNHDSSQKLYSKPTNFVCQTWFLILLRETQYYHDVKMQYKKKTSRLILKFSQHP